jgi:glycosyltransferase involved in cell wall biosynthesis
VTGLDAALIAAALVYIGTLVWLGIGLRRPAPPASDEQPAVTVLVAARNEEWRLGPCLAALQRQDYAGWWEVIVVDDRSTDGTPSLLARAAAGWPRLHWRRAPEPPAYRCPKKSALAHGIAAAGGDLLLCTDADCRPPAGWISAMVAAFAPGVGLVAGYSYPESAPRWRQRVLALENIAVGALSAGSLAMGRPLACTGRNLAYRRQAFAAVGGFASVGHLVGGDDVYLMRQIARGTQWRLVFQRDPRAAVPCAAPPTTWAAIAQQKIRHAAKAGNYGGWAVALGAGVYLFHLLLAVQLARAAAGVAAWTPVAAVWAARWLVDLALVSRMALPAERRLLPALPLLELCYIPYVLVGAVLGKLGWFRWR